MMPPGQHYAIRELYGEPILQTAFDGEPKLPNQKLRSGSNRNPRSAGGGGRSAQPMPNPMDAPSYDGGMGAAAALGMPWMMGGMPGGGMPSGGMPFGFPAAARPAFPGFPGMAGFPGAMMPGLGAATGRFQGHVKSFNVQKGFGFIECPEAHQVYGRDVFLHKAQIGTLQIGSQVSFAVEMNKTNMPQARDLMEIDIGGYGGAMPGLGFSGMSMGMGGAGGKGGNQKGSGKGKGGGGKTNKGKGGKGSDNKKAGDNKKSGGAGGKPQQQPQQQPPQQPQELPP